MLHAILAGFLAATAGASDITGSCGPDNISIVCPQTITDASSPTWSGAHTFLQGITLPDYTILTSTNGLGVQENSSPTWSGAHTFLQGITLPDYTILTSTDGLGVQAGDTTTWTGENRYTQPLRVETSSNILGDFIASGSDPILGYWLRRLGLPSVGFGLGLSSGGANLHQLLGYVAFNAGGEVSFGVNPYRNQRLSFNPDGSAELDLDSNLGNPTLTVSGAINASTFTGSASGLTNLPRIQASGFSSTLGVGTTFYAFRAFEDISLDKLTITVVSPGVGGAGDTYRCQDTLGNFISATVPAASAAGYTIEGDGPGLVGSGQVVYCLLYDSSAITTPSVNISCAYSKQ